jgi:ATP-binding cassette, subfamily B, bacterial MsbA
MSKATENVLADPATQGLIKRVLRENFHLYRGRYALAFMLMGCTALATGCSAFLMKTITTVLFASPESRAAPTPEAPFNSHGMTWLAAAHDGWVGITRSFDSYFAKPGMDRVIGVALAILIVFLVKGFSQYGSTVVLSKIGNNIIARQQRRISSHILDQSLVFFGHFPSSDLITRISQAASAARGVMDLLMTRIQDVLVTLALVWSMFALDWRLSSIAIFIMLPVFFGLNRIIKRIKEIAKAEYSGIAEVITAIQESIIGNKVVKSYNLESHMRSRFETSIDGLEKRGNKMARVSSRTSPLMETMGGIAIATIVLYAGYQNVVHGKSAAALIGFLTALLLAYDPIKRIAKMNVQLHTQLVGLGMMYQLLDTDHSIPDVPDAKPIEVQKGELILNDVTFAYRTDLAVLRNVSLTCPGGHVTALVGPSGSGKSTILNLIERFYANDSGEITIDGQNINQVTTASLRREISLVSQDTFLFADTLRNNIRLARPAASDAEIEDAARAAFAHDFILEQPQGYDTHVGENGGNLSGGQRQRISIARAFLKNAPILLLDEATSALDSESEQKIQIAFDHLMQGRTTIVIAHRFSTIRNAKTIHVMQDGKVVASGSHNELVSDEASLYAHLYRLQYQGH